MVRRYNWQMRIETNGAPLSPLAHSPSPYSSGRDEGGAPIAPATFPPMLSLEGGNPFQRQLFVLRAGTLGELRTGAAYGSHSNIVRPPN